MKIKFEQVDFKDMQKNLPEYLEKKHSDILKVTEEDSKKGYWRLKGNGVNVILTKSKGFFKYIDYEQSPTSIKPHYTIINDKKSSDGIKSESLTIFFFRKQVVSGSTDQKLPYSIYLLKDYLEKYKLLDKFKKVNLVLVLDNHFEKGRYKDLLSFINENENTEIMMKEFEI